MREKYLKAIEDIDEHNTYDDKAKPITDNQDEKKPPAVNSMI